jgi:hypothetical protein
MVPHLSEVRARCRKAVGSIHLVPVKRKRCVTTKADDSREEACPPWSSCGIRSAGRQPTSREAWESRATNCPEFQTSAPEREVERTERRLDFAPRRHSVPTAPCARSGKGAPGPEESRPKPKGSWTAAPELLRGDRSARLAAPAVRRENETGKDLFATASSRDRLRRLRAAAVVAGRVRPMRRQEEGGRPVLPPKEEPRWRKKRESTREEAHPPPLWATRNVSALTRGDEREADGASLRLSVRNRAGAPALSPTGSTWRPAATGKITGFGLHRVTETPSPSHHGRRRQTRGNPRTSRNATDACIWSATGSAPRNPAAAPVSHRLGGKEAAAAPSSRPNPRVRKDPGSGQDLERGPRA